jgi:pimeloyl-ACP methyl ester carboxylesterase
VPKSRQEVRARLRMVEAPVLVITGELDAMTGVRPGAAWAGCFPNGRHESMTRSGHNPWVDRADPFAKLARDFLSVAQADG